PYVNKQGLPKAKELQKTATGLFSEYEYRKVIETVNEALAYISKVPILTIKVTPEIFSPDNDGKNDVLEIVPDIFSITKLDRWIAAVTKQEEGQKQGIEIIKWAEKGDPPKVIKWDGKIDGRLAVDSASSYVAELVVIDEKNAVESSGKVRFKTDIFTEETERGLLIDVSSIIFDYNSDVLKPEYKPIVKMVYDFLLRYPEYSIIIEGHTDSSGPAQRNKALSEKRAQSVTDYLVELGMKKDSLEAYGLGESLPKTMDKNKMGLNRRVAFILIKNKDDMMKYKYFVKKLRFDREVEMR
ncbi:MAG: OmpA family protein, partial [Spirochaetes bacterium]|nr:OmpA family protein [Spirochaetota bacterium]